VRSRLAGECAKAHHVDVRRPEVLVLVSLNNSSCDVATKTGSALLNLQAVPSLAIDET